SKAEFLGRRVLVGERSSLVARVCRGDEPEVVTSTRHSRLLDQPLTTMLGAQSLLAVPISKGRKKAGVLLFVRRRAEQPFTERDLAKAELLVSQAVFAITNAQLYTQQRHRAEELGALYEFTRAVSSAISPAAIAS